MSEYAENLLQTIESQLRKLDMDLSFTERMASRLQVLIGEA